MNQLFTYIEAINGVDEKVRIVNKVITNNAYNDQGVTVTNFEALLSFSNGVILKHSIESDELPPSSEVCPEYWISYEVIDSSTESVSPMKKTFLSKCQESFWLKIQKTT
ncbi:hypothetical protein [Moritella viscosa]|uniref:Uncharacterized protein n=1 Tax=Moritella viscosa TaxID=80854 RepID=A0ABY1H9J2_9GAMM|nr:hypothetical protein [Moritella viscosa]CED58917.1 putative uncharacterized protein [Moritella viscosa]SGY84328.1 Putative uncharacterized protein [Moritella viscosa]SGY86362.1 Putative uncharacterized protein [Moritella viscosa]SHN98538.1 Putative uncharacterized protein [Moritella viscosa]SHO19899.1 Putative uncharacterized protein [Moritella viscosa]